MGQELRGHLASGSAPCLSWGCSPLEAWSGLEDLPPRRRTCLYGGLPLGCSGIFTGSRFPRASDPRGEEATEPSATLPWKSHSFTSRVSYRSHRSAPCGVEGREYQEVRNGDRSWRLPAKCHNLSASLSVKWDHLPPLGAVRCSKQEAWRKAVGRGPHIY